MKLGKSQRDKDQIKVASVAAFNGDGRLLFGQRNDNGKWTLPGGHLEEGEDPKRAAVRELLEEAGLKAQRLTFLGEEELHGGKLKVYAFRAEVDGEASGAKDPDEECSKWEWVDGDKVPEHILGNLHAPKNVTLQLLGLQAGGEPEETVCKECGSEPGCNIDCETCTPPASEEAPLGKALLEILNLRKARDIEAHPNFRAWFGASKMTDEFGRPKTLYRGVRRAGHIGGILDTTSFADSPDVASIYAATPGDVWASREAKFNEGANVFPVYMRMASPLDLGDSHQTYFSDYLKALRFGQENGITHEEATKVLNYLVNRTVGHPKIKAGEFRYQALDEDGEPLEDELYSLTHVNTGLHQIRDDFHGLENDDALDVAGRLSLDTFALADCKRTRLVAQRLGHDGIVHRDVLSGLNGLAPQLLNKKPTDMAGIDQEYGHDSSWNAKPDFVHTTYRPFTPHQVKSVHNDGTFDSGSEDLMKNEQKTHSFRDIEVGALAEENEHTKTFDYDHVLPEGAPKGMSLRVLQHKDGNVNARLSYRGKRIGFVTAETMHHPAEFKLWESRLKADHRGRGLGLAMYEALMGHMVNAQGRNVLLGGAHSSDASAVHQKLAQKYGIEYKVDPNFPSETYPTQEAWEAAPTGQNDFKYGPYRYMLKADTLSQQLDAAKKVDPYYQDWVNSRQGDLAPRDEIERMMMAPDSTDAELSLKMEGVTAAHLAYAIHNNDVSRLYISDIMKHPAFNKQNIHDMLSKSDMWWDYAMAHPQHDETHIMHMLDTMRGMGHHERDSAWNACKDSPHLNADHLSMFIDEIGKWSGQNKLISNTMARDILEHPNVDQDDVRDAFDRLYKNGDFAYNDKDGLTSILTSGIDHLSGEQLEKVVKDPSNFAGPLVRGAFGAPEFPHHLVDDLMSPMGYSGNPQLDKAWIAKYPALEKGTLMPQMVLQELAQNQFLKPHHYDWLIDRIGDPNRVYNSFANALANNPALSSDHLKRLVQQSKFHFDSGQTPYSAVMHHRHVSEDVIKEATQSTTAEWRRAAAKVAPAHMLDDIWKNISWKDHLGNPMYDAENIRANIFKNPNVQERHFQAAATQSDKSVTEAAMNASKSPEAYANWVVQNSDHTFRNAQNAVRSNVTPTVYADHLLKLLKRYDASGWDSPADPDDDSPELKSMEKEVAGEHLADISTWIEKAKRPIRWTEPSDKAAMEHAVNAIAERWASDGKMRHLSPDGHGWFIGPELAEHPLTSNASLHKMYDAIPDQEDVAVRDYGSADATDLRAKIIAHPNADDSLLKKAATSKLMQYHVAAAPTASTELLRHVYQNLNPEEDSQDNLKTMARVLARHPNTPSDVLHGLAISHPGHYNAMESVIKHANVSPDTLRHLADSSDTDEELQYMAKERYAMFNPDGEYPKSALMVRVGKAALGKIRKIRDLIMERNPTTRQAHPKELPPGDWSVGRIANGNISADALQQHIDSTPASRWNHSFSEWDGAQRHSSEDSKVFQLNISNDHVREMQKQGVWGTFQNMLAASTFSSHPVTPHTIGWVRYTGGNEPVPQKPISPQKNPKEFAAFMRQEIARVQPHLPEHYDQDWDESREDLKSNIDNLEESSVGGKYFPDKHPYIRWARKYVPNAFYAPGTDSEKAHRHAVHDWVKDHIERNKYKFTADLNLVTHPDKRKELSDYYYRLRNANPSTQHAYATDNDGNDVEIPYHEWVATNPFVKWAQANPGTPDAFKDMPQPFEIPPMEPRATKPMGYFVDEVQSDFGQSFVKQAQGQARLQAEQEAMDRGMNAEDARAHVNNVMGQAATRAQAKYPEEHYQKIAQILFNGKHPNEVVAEGFMEHLRAKGEHDATVQWHSVESKAPLSGVTHTKERPAPGHFHVSYSEVPKKLGFEPSTYGKLETQTGDGDENSTGKPTWEGKVRKFEDELGDWLKKMAISPLDIAHAHRGQNKVAQQLAPIQHEMLRDVHPPHVEPLRNDFQRLGIESPTPVGQAMAPGGTTAKSMINLTPDSRMPKRVMIKPFYEHSPPHMEGVDHPIHGWAELTSQSLYHAAGIGHLHQNSHLAEFPEPMVAVHFENGHKPFAYTPFTSSEEKEGLHHQARQIGLMDFLTDNNDRHDLNLLVNDSKTALKAIDHSFAFQYSHPGHTSREPVRLPMAHYFEDGMPLADLTEEVHYDEANHEQIRKNWAPVIEWWGQQSRNVREAMQQQTQAIRDPILRDHIARNFKVRADHLDALAAIPHFAQNGPLDWSNKPVTQYRVGENEMTWAGWKPPPDLQPYVAPVNDTREITQNEMPK